MELSLRNSLTLEPGLSYQRRATRQRHPLPRDTPRACGGCRTHSTHASGWYTMVTATGGTKRVNHPLEDGFTVRTENGILVTNRVKKAERLVQDLATISVAVRLLRSPSEVDVLHTLPRDGGGTSMLSVIPRCRALAAKDRDRERLYYTACGPDSVASGAARCRTHHGGSIAT